MVRSDRYPRRRSNRFAIPGLAIIVISLLAVATAVADSELAIQFDVPGDVPLLTADYGLVRTVEVTIGDQEISPTRLEVAQGTRIAWRSEAPEAMRISFASHVARAMRCTSVVNFALDGDRLRSARLETGETAHFCELAPGSYRYRVERDRQSVRRGTISGRMVGNLVVLGPDLAAR